MYIDYRYTAAVTAVSEGQWFWACDPSGDSGYEAIILYRIAQMNATDDGASEDPKPR